MHKASRLAAAFAFIATPVLADEPSCTKIDENNYAISYLAGNGVNVKQTIDVAGNKLCFGMEVPDGAKSVDPSIDKPFCFDLKGSPDQVMTPVIVGNDGVAYIQHPSTLGDAMASFANIVKLCVPKGTPASYYGKLTFPQPL